MLENFRRTFSPGPTYRPWVSEDAVSIAWRGVQIQALEKSSFDNPSVLAIVILPYTERTRCDQILKSVLNLSILGVIFSHSQSL